MDPKNQPPLAARVDQAATAALSARGYVSTIDILMVLGWLTQTRLDEWRQRSLPFLEAGIPTNPLRVREAATLFRTWAEGQDLKPSETGYVARTASKQTLRFSESGAPEIEQAYRTHWVSRGLFEKKPT